LLHRVGPPKSSAQNPAGFRLIKARHLQAPVPFCRQTPLTLEALRSKDLAARLQAKRRALGVTFSQVAW
jgi:hypothetical protein